MASNDDPLTTVRLFFFFFEVMAMKSGIISKYLAEILPVIGFGCLQQGIQLVDYALHPAEAPSLNKFFLRKSLWPYSFEFCSQVAPLPHPRI